MSTALTQNEVRRLDELEGIINRGLQTFVEVGSALAEIRDSRLYRKTHNTFEDYCRKRWEMSRIQAHRLISASDTVEMLPIGNAPTKEAQVRPLTSRQIEPEQKREAWKRATEAAEVEGVSVAARHVEGAIEKVRPRREVAPPRLPPVPRVREMIRAAVDLEEITQDQIAALPMNDITLAHLRRAYEIIGRILHTHSRRQKDVQG